MDVVGALAALFLLLPVFVLAVVVIRLGSPGPIFFIQQRAGLLGCPFLIWKFRTLRTNTDSRRHRAYVSERVGSDATSTKLDECHQTIAGGAWLRALAIDELPQLWNVLRGEMSLVGPRPDVVAYEEYDARQRRRFEVLPGMTGLWQVSGKNRTTFAEMMELDLAYVQRRSFWLDLRILLLTLPAIVRDCVSEKPSPSNQ